MAKGTGRKAGGGLARPVTPSPALAAIVGPNPLPRSEVVSKVWDHIKKNNLQNPQNKREIIADDKRAGDRDQGGGSPGSPGPASALGTGMLSAVHST